MEKPAQFRVETNKTSSLHGSTALATVWLPLSVMALRKTTQAFEQRSSRRGATNITEVQITKLKLVRRQMYSRGELDLLQA